MKSLPAAIVALGVVVLVILSQSIYMVHQVEQVLIVQWGRPDRSVTTPGLHLKIPLYEQVLIFEKRLLAFDQEPQEVLSSDKKNLKVDSYARWRIKDPLKFYQTVRTEVGATSRLNDIIYSNLREILGQYSMLEIVSGSRTDLMSKIRDLANKQAVKMGVEVVDVRIKRTDLPAENSKAVYRRMQTERERQAKQYRAQGDEQAAKIRASADAERAIVLASADRDAQKLRGEGEGEATAIYANAFQKDPRFYFFNRSMEAYRKSFMNSDTTMVLDPKGGFFKHFHWEAGQQLR
ncbi:MAG: protease modulator HflC [Magnetococcales bacterium]|nr:protease modulator HflC [Magnetococcales bacterium]NGZ26154.1 protease modulator HflC [Magnetococcales bacterium]